MASYSGDLDLYCRLRREEVVEMAASILSRKLDHGEAGYKITVLFDSIPIIDEILSTSGNAITGDEMDEFLAGPGEDADNGLRKDIATATQAKIEHRQQEEIAAAKARAEQEARMETERQRKQYEALRKKFESPKP